MIKFLLILLLTPILSLAHDIKGQIEDDIANRLDISNVILILPFGVETLDGYEFVDLEIDENQSGKVNLILIKDSVDNRINIEAKFKEAVLVPALSKTYAKGESINESDIVLIKHPKDKTSDRYITQKDDLIGMIAKRNIKPMMYITQSSVSKPILINKKDIVDIVYVKGNVMLQGTAIALESGGKDDLIKLKNPDSNKVFVAKVLDKNKAVIQR